MVEENDSSSEGQTPDRHWLRQAELLDAALPDLSCPACKSLTFNLLIPKTGGLQTVKIMHRVVGGPDNYRTPSVMFEETVTVSCASCGYLMEFVEDSLRERAERAGWRDRQDG